MTAKSSLVGAPKILFADDELQIRKAFARTFRRPAWEVDLAANGHEALSLGQHGRYDVVVIDHQMPGPCGKTLINELRKHQITATFVVITGYSELAQESCRTPGVSVVVSKPWDEGALRSILMAGAAA